MTRPLFRRTLEGFAPYTDEAQKLFERTKLGETVELKGVKVRNGAYHRLFFAMLKLISENSEPHITPEEALYLAKVGAGCGSWIETPSRTLFAPGSIAFAKMKQDDFEAFVKSAIPPLCHRFMNGTDAEAVRAEAMELAG